MHDRRSRLPRLAAAVATVLSLSLAPPLLAQKGTAAGEQQAAFQMSPSWRTFLAERGGEWRIDWCAATGTPRAIYGTGLDLADWRGNTLDEARRQAHQLLRDQAELLRLGTSDFRETIGSRMGRTWSFVFDQFHAGLPVIGGRADVRVSMRGRIAMFGSTAWQIPANFGTTPTIDGDTALALAWQALGEVATDAPQPKAPAAPRLVIWGDVHAATPGTVHLAWECAIRNVDRNGKGSIGRSYVDATNGQVLQFVSDKHECGFAGCSFGEAPSTPTAAAATSNAPLAAPVLTTVTVRGWTRTGNDAFDPLVDTPLPGIELNVPGIGVVTTNASGQVQINIASPVTITINGLDGRHHALVSGSNQPSGSWNVNPGVATTITLLSSGATPEQAAHTTVSWWTDRTNEFVRSILGNTPQITTASAMTVTVNIADTCNAYYTGNSINFFSTGGGCSNTAFSTVVAHEWGHGLDDRYGGISQVNGLSEGWGDTLAFYLVDNPILGSGFSTAGVGIRNGNNTRQYPDGGGVHAQGESWMGFAWNLRDRLATTLGSRPAAIALSNDIVIGSIVADATDQPAALLEVFLADDNDGNLTNGTPNSVDLTWAANQHSIPVPGAPSVVPNDECAGAIALTNGVNGPFSTVGAYTSAPAWPCASGGRDAWFTFYVAQSGTLTVQTCGQATWDTALQIFSGSCGALTSLGCVDDSCASLQSSLAVPVNPGLHYIRVGGFNSATGSFSLDVNGPGGVPATATNYGTGCYRASKAFYELYPNTGFDLSGTSMRLTRLGDLYLVQSGGAYVAPTPAAQLLNLGDDAVTTVALGGTLLYPGGSTTSLEVCSNGFVSPVTGNGNAYTPTAAAWLASTQPRWGTWHDFNPAAAGSGRVKFEKIGNIAYVTWDGVYSYNTTTPNTWQLQFDLLTGFVTFVWPNVVSSGNGWLVGFAAAAPNDDLGSFDLSTMVPATFRTSSYNALPLALASTLPQLGTTLTMTTSQFPPTSLLGIQLVSFTAIDPGVELGFLGMPGCYVYAGTDAMYALLPTSGQAQWQLPVPNNPSLMGAQLAGQSAAFAPGANTAGLITSNGVRLTIGV